MTAEEKETTGREAGGLWKVIRREPIGLLAVLIALASLVWSIHWSLHSERAEDPALSVRNAAVRLDRSRTDADGGEVWKLHLFVYACNTGRRPVGLRDKGRMVVLRDNQPVFSTEGFLRNPEPGQDRYDLTVEGLSEKRLVLEIPGLLPGAQLPRRELSQERVKELAGQGGVTYLVELSGPGGLAWNTSPSVFNIGGTIIVNRDDRTRVLRPGAVFEGQPTTGGERLEP